MVPEEEFEAESVKEPGLAQTRPLSSTTRSTTLSVVDWLELKRKSDLQEETIQKLAYTFEELGDKVSRMQREAIQPQLGTEEDYPLAEKETYKERTTEYSITDLSREHAEYDVVSTNEEEEISIPLYHLP